MNGTRCHLCEVKATNTLGDIDKHEYGRVSDSDNESTFSYCTSCQEKQDNLYETLPAPTFEISPFTSPTISSPSTDGYASIYNECLAEENSINSGYQDEEEGEKLQEDIRNGLKTHLKTEVISMAIDEIFLPIVEIGREQKDDDTVLGEVIPLTSGVDQQSFYTSFNNVSTPESEKIQVSEVSNFFEDSEHRIWEPPEPEYIEDEVDGSVTNYYDDEDEFGDGVEWNKVSSLGRLCENNKKLILKEEKERTLRNVMSGKFKSFVCQLLKSLNVEPSGAEENESWVDVVISLSWEAALFVRPDFSVAKTMDLDSCIKVKCVASGVRNQSKVIKGLVFKKHAAHKHMPTECKNPKLMMISGGIGQSVSGLSSFDLMEQEKNSLKSCIDVIENCRPNVVLVEKSVSRDVQEFFLNKGMTLVFDMKLHRLERIARHTGSLIFSFGALIVQKLKQCSYLHFEKFTEEHYSSSEGGKRPTKTLLFLEGCPTRVGCTILLRGSHDSELKKIKSVVRCAFFMAYHLLRETSFLIDQRAMFCTTSFLGSRNTSPMKRCSVDSTFSYAEETFLAHPESPYAVDIPVLGPDELGVSIEDNIPLRQQSPPSSLNQTSKGCNGTRASFPSTRSEYTPYLSDIEVTWSSDEEDNPAGLFPFTEDYYVDAEKSEKAETCNDQINTESLQELQSVLVLMSSRNSKKGIICERSHFSHIKFYKNFDLPLGKFFKDSLLNQRHLCVTCGEPSEVHFYYYAHHSKQLTIQVKKLPSEKCLPGEAEGKLWMWSRCIKCRCEDGAAKSTKRVLVSATSWSLSFGKFLEIGFSQYNSCMTSTCGHSLEEDFLYFFGLGPMVAMLRYSHVITYAVFTPPHKLEFSSSTGKEWLDKEIQNVYKKGISIFLEVDASLELLGSKYGDHPLSFGASFQKLSDVEDLLKKEKIDFEVKVKSVKCSKFNNSSYGLLSLNGISWELLLLSSLWNHRLSLLSSHFASSHDLPVLVIPVEGSHPSGKGDSSRDASELPRSPSNGHIGPSRPKHHFLESVWAPLSDIVHECTNSHPRGSLPRIELPSLASTEIDPGVSHFTEDELSRSFVRVGPVGFTVADFEGELSSIIACALALQRPNFDHRMVVSLKHDHILSVSSYTKIQPPNREEEEDDEGVGRDDDLHRSISAGVLPVRPDIDHPTPTVPLEESRFSSFDGLNLLSTLVSPAVDHPEIPIGVGKLAGKAKYSVVCIYSDKFERLRNLCCSSELDYTASLSRCVNWEAKGGKSKSFFAKTLDERFIIKEIKKTEMDSFMKFAPYYFDYMNQFFQTGNQSCLAKILGIYQVKQMKKGKEVKQDVMVMENLMYGRKVTRQYDLKGALHARFNSAVENGSMDVLLDQNFVNDMNMSPFYVSNKGKRLLQRSIWNDTTFLNSINVMDYSLLVGVDVETGELSFGIIDYLRQYTWDKQLETWVKSSLVVPKHLMPTVVSPVEYKKRFRKFLSTHFLSVPDNWCASPSESDDP